MRLQKIVDDQQVRLARVVLVRANGRFAIAPRVVQRVPVHAICELDWQRAWLSDGNISCTHCTCCRVAHVRRRCDPTQSLMHVHACGRLLCARRRPKSHSKWRHKAAHARCSIDLAALRASRSACMCLRISECSVQFCARFLHAPTR